MVLFFFFWFEHISKIGRKKHQQAGHGGLEINRNSGRVPAHLIMKPGRGINFHHPVALERSSLVVEARREQGTYTFHLWWQKHAENRVLRHSNQM